MNLSMSKGLKGLVFTCLAVSFISHVSSAQHSVARQWNEVLLESIRNDFARPTVHARNLFHTSMAMYDSWAVYDTVASTYFLNNTLRTFFCPFDGVPPPEDVEAARNEAISYASYRIIRHRFSESPGKEEIRHKADSLMVRLGYDTTYTSTDYANGTPADLGNYIAQQIIAFGLQDESNEINAYINKYYEPLNETLIPEEPGNPDLQFPNNWQPLTLQTFIDQSGNVIPLSTPSFLSPEWGKVIPFALDEKDLKIYMRDTVEYWVYHDPGPPPYINLKTGEGLDDDYKWNFAMVSVWGAHLDPADSVMIDISPASFGNNPIEDFPTDHTGFRDLYDYFEGGDFGKGREVNPHTGLPYEPQMVPRGDYARVLAEFWADGPDSETPPGHWYTIMNYVHDHPDFERRYRGEGPELDELEWDVKAYFALGGAVHDAAISAWGVKGWYDYIRPISAIRWMADQGQSSDPEGLNYSPGGIPLIEGYIEQVQPGDTLAGEMDEHVGKIKLYTWRGPDFIEDPDTTVAGVGWILAENFWPYQRPTFITPPFAGYVSGHSTYSRAAAELLTLLTGDEYFPGGMGEFLAAKNEFLVFEDGPSEDLTLQWATYRDASDQTSLSRIWGGIHPPADDIPGRQMGVVIGTDAFEYADCYFNAPDEIADTMVSPCDDALVVIPLDAEGVERWEWTAEATLNVGGVTFQGTSEAGGMIRDTLQTDSSSGVDGSVLYTITGYLNNCVQVRQTYSVKIENTPAPDAAFDVMIEDSVVTFLNLSSDAGSYFWDFGDGSTDTIAEPNHTYSSVGEYTVRLITTNVCGSDTTEMMIQINTARSRTPTRAEFIRLSPNPVSDILRIETDGLTGEGRMVVFDNSGRIQSTRDIALGDPILFDVSELPAGVYYLGVRHEDGVDVDLFIVQ